MDSYKNLENRMAAPLEATLARGASRRYLKEEARKSAYAETERRLYALPILHERIADNREELCELEGLGVEALKEHSSSLVRILRPGIRLTPEEVHAAQMAELRGRLAADEREVRKMQTAMGSIESDPYFPLIEMKYFKNKKETEVAEKLCCDPSTVRRNRVRLVRRLSLRLYGVE